MKTASTRSWWVFGLVGLVVLAGAVPALAQEALLSVEKWWPFKVESYYGKYSAEEGVKVQGIASKSLKGPKVEDWVPPEKAKKSYRLGISFPHMKDPYWLAVEYGIMSECKRLRLECKLVEAGGYVNLNKQIDQIENLAAEGMDGIIVGAISYSAQDKMVEEITKKRIPVIEVINDIRAPAIRAKALVSFYEMGYKAGEFVAQDAKGKKEVNVVFLPGPAGAGWTTESLRGFEDATKKLHGGVRILSIKWGDTGKDIQQRLVEDMLQAFPKIDYIAGNAVAADAAVGPLRERGRDKEIKVVSTYMIPPVYDQIVAKRIAAAPSDLQAFQGRMSVDMMVMLLEGKKPGVDFPFRSGPIIPVVTTENVAQYPYENLFNPRPYRPVYNVKP